jgi:4-amino-4-deoxy-L-arabinose transferase-like glycosyltransferase
MYWRSIGTNLHRRLTLLLSKEQAVVVGLCCLSALALFTRFWAIDHKSLWLDEAQSWQTANASLKNMFDLTAQDAGHPPFYYGVLHFWTQLAGNSEASLRAPSALSGAGTIVLLAVVAWRVGGWLLALAASLLLLSNGVFLAASQEARMYALVGLLTLASSVALAAFIAKPSVVRFVAYAALAIGLIYTHYSGFIAVAAQGLVLGVYGLDRAIRKRNGWILVAGLVFVAVLILAYIPWWSTFRAHPDQGLAGGYPQASVELVTNTGRSALGLDEAHGGWLVLALPLLLLGLYGLAKRWRDPRALSVGAIALVPVGQILISIWYEPILDARQVAPYIPGLAFVCALGFVEAVALPGRLVRFAPAGYAAVLLAGMAMLVLMTMRVEQIYYGPPRQDWRAVEADLRGAPVVIAPGWQNKSLEYYRGSAFGVTPLWLGIVGKMTVGYVPIPRASIGSETTLVLQGYKGHALLPGLQQYFSTEVLHAYTEFITTYRLRPLATSEYNVGLFGGYQTPGAWITTPDGLLQTASDTSYFWLLSPSDRDHANGVDEDYTVHIEYLDRGPPSFTLVGLDPSGARYTLNQVPIDGTGEWKAIDVPVKRGAVLAGVFYLTSGVTIRTLEMRRYQLVGVDAPRSSADPAQQWFLRTDGFLEYVGQTACVTPTEPSAGAAGSVLDFTSLYAGRWVDSTANPAPDGRLCLPALPSPYSLIVRRVALRPAG